ncbi:MAG: cyclic nucleotide-binding domain-containing protein [Nitrospirae bacterium]|nr:cyclic nucleotide-binding domain-containing protein [Nitrospirota bacterium]
MDDETKRRIEFLKGVPLFSKLKERHLKSLASLGKEVEYEAGRVIVKEGETGAGFFLILQGKVEVIKGDKKIAGLGEGDYFGEIALLDGGPRTATVIAKEDTRCLYLVIWSFRSFIKSHPEVSLALLEAVSRRMRRHEEIKD